MMRYNNSFSCKPLFIQLYLSSCLHFLVTHEEWFWWWTVMIWFCLIIYTMCLSEWWFVLAKQHCRIACIHILMEKKNEQIKKVYDFILNLQILDYFLCACMSVSMSVTLGKVHYRLLKEEESCLFSFTKHQLNCC